MRLADLTGGKRLFFSIALPLFYLTPLAALWFLPKDFGFGFRGMVYAGLTVGISGLALWMLAMAHLGKSFAVLPEAGELVTRGVYRRFRHPVYRGIEMTILGLSLLCGSVAGVLYVLLVLVPLNFWRAGMEDRALEEKFGPAYRTWRDQTWF